jgi:hypothetical protein
MAGVWPRDALAMTLPELSKLVRGYQRAHGIDPDAPGTQGMSRTRLQALAERYG